MPSRKRAPTAAPRHCSPSAMHNPSPPRRTVAPVTSAVRATIGKRCQAGMLIGLTVPAGTSIGPADAIPMASTVPPAAANAPLSRLSAAAQIVSASARGVGSSARVSQRAGVVDQSHRQLVPPMSRASVSIRSSSRGTSHPRRHRHHRVGQLGRLQDLEVGVDHREPRHHRRGSSAPAVTMVASGPSASMSTEPAGKCGATVSTGA